MDALNGDDIDQPAQVVANRCRIRYHRQGSGTPVILLRPPELSASIDATLLPGLAARFRVLVPVAAEPLEAARVVTSALPGPGRVEAPDDTLRWLTCFVEGLGIMGAGVVAAGRYRSAAMDVAAALPDHLAKVVLLDDPERAPPALPRVVSFLLGEENSRPA